MRIKYKGVVHEGHFADEEATRVAIGGTKAKPMLILPIEDVQLLPDLPPEPPHDETTVLFDEASGHLFISPAGRSDWFRYGGPVLRFASWEDVPHPLTPEFTRR